MGGILLHRSETGSYKPLKQTKSLGKKLSQLESSLFICFGAVYQTQLLKPLEWSIWKCPFTINGILSMATIQHFIYLNVRNCGKFMRKTLASVQQNKHEAERERERGAKTECMFLSRSSGCLNENIPKCRIQYFNWMGNSAKNNQAINCAM